MNYKPCMTRRHFMQCAGVGLAAAVLPRTAKAAAPAAPPAAAPETAPISAPGEFRRGGMVYRPLGSTGMNLSLLAFGSHTDRAYKLRGGIRNVLNTDGQARRDRQISLAMDMGVNLIDVYEHEGQWEPLAKLLKPRRDKVFVAGAYDNPEFIGQNIDRLAKRLGKVDFGNQGTVEKYARNAQSRLCKDRITTPRLPIEPRQHVKTAQANTYSAIGLPGRTCVKAHSLGAPFINVRKILIEIMCPYTKTDKAIDPACRGD